MANSWNGGTTTINPTTLGNRSSGYDSYNAVIGQMGANIGTSGAPHNNSDDKWTRWFGIPPYSNFQKDNYAELGHENYTLPTAYIGRNLHIEKLLNVSIASNDDFYTRVLLPWQQYDGMQITWSKWSGFDHLMVQVPEEVPAPQIQTRFESGSAYQQRYGLAFKMEHGFQKTQMGQQAYNMNLSIITQAVLRTVYARVMQVLVQQRNFLSVVAGQNYATDLARAREISKGSTLTFGALQKNTFGFDNALASCMKLFENRRLAQPDAVVIPHGSFGVLKMCKPESRTYAICGDLAQRLDISPTRDFVSNIYNNQFQIFEHRPMNISQDSNEINMLTRNRDVGNVFRIFRDGVSYSGTKGQSMQTAIKIVDHDKQRWRTISLIEGLQNSGAFDADGDLSQNFIIQSGWFDVTSNAKFGDIKKEYLQDIISEVVNSIEDLSKLPNYKNATETTNAPIGRQAGNPPPTIPSASVTDVRDAIIAAIVGASSDIGSDNDVVEAAENLATTTTESMPSGLRGAVIQVLGQEPASVFRGSRKVVSSINKNSSSSKAPELKQKLLKAMQSDFRANWSQVSRASREALRDAEAAVSAYQAPSAVPIGADTSGQGLYGDPKWTKWCNIEINLKNIKACDELGVVTPFGCYVMRPFQSFEMGSMIVMKSGTDTGMTVCGNSDFQLGDSVTNKTHLGHFTFYFESVVHEPNHVMIVRDAMFMKYNGGAGGRFHKWGDPFDPKCSLFSVLALHCESKETYMHDPMDINGKFESSSLLAPLNDSGLEHYLASKFYKNQWKIVNGGDSGSDASTMDANDAPFYVDGATNSVLYQGLQLNRGASGEFDNPITNTGHLGDSETVDSSLTWSGHMSFKTSVGYHHSQNTVGLLSKST